MSLEDRSKGPGRRSRGARFVVGGAQGAACTAGVGALGKRAFDTCPRGEAGPAGAKGRRRRPALRPCSPRRQ
eukprot:3393836-Pleurochrysis_carterae.AAC.1